MRSMLSAVVGLSLLVGGAQGVLAKCGDNAGDEQAVINARNNVESTCHCAASTNHGQFVSCAAGVANSDANLPKSCKGVVKKCAAHSSCGSAGKVTCCITKGSKTKCKIASTAAKCTGKGGKVGGFSMMATSCCSNAHPLSDNSCVASPSGAFLN